MQHRFEAPPLHRDDGSSVSPPKAPATSSRRRPVMSPSPQVLVAVPQVATHGVERDAREDASPSATIMHLKERNDVLQEALKRLVSEYKAMAVAHAARISSSAAPTSTPRSRERRAEGTDAHDTVDNDVTHDMRQPATDSVGSSSTVATEPLLMHVTSALEEVTVSLEHARRDNAELTRSLQLVAEERDVLKRRCDEAEHRNAQLSLELEMLLRQVPTVLLRSPTGVYRSTNFGSEFRETPSSASKGTTELSRHAHSPQPSTASSGTSLATEGMREVMKYASSARTGAGLSIVPTLSLNAACSRGDDTADVEERAAQVVERSRLLRSRVNVGFFSH